jgi:hypothetical protein
MRVTLLVPKLFLLVILAAGLSSTANAITIDSTYTFAGTCTIDCTGTGTGTLVLANYTLGNSVTTANFISFTYNSDILNYSINASQLSEFDGSLVGPFPAFEDISITSNSNGTLYGNFTTIHFVSDHFGDWCTGGFGACSGDSGTNGIWANAVAGVPEPATYLSVLLAGAALLVLRRKR